MRKIATLVLLLAATLTGVATAQSASSRWFFAADFNKWALAGQNGTNNFTFNASLQCIPNPYNAQSYAFNTNASVYINDTATPANSEVVTVASLANSAGVCGFNATVTHTHYANGFQVQSGTGGLQEILNWLSKTSSYPATVILDQTWYGAINTMSLTPATVIAAASGGAGITLLDSTQSPWQQYTWDSGAGKYLKNSLGQSTYGNQANAQYFGYKNTGLTAIAIPTAGAFGVSANAAGIAAATYRVAQTCVDPLGGETLISTDSSSTVTTTSPNGNITAAAPTCAAGSVGWRLYISAASGGTGSEILYAPKDAGCTAATTGVRPSCALTSGSVTSALVTGTALVPTEASAYAMAIEAEDTLPTPYLRSWPPFVVTGVQTFTTAYTIAQFSFPAGYLNQVGKSVQVCGNYNLTPSATGTDAVTVLGANAYGVSPNTLITWTSGALTNAAYEAPFCFTMTTAVAGASGTVEIHGQMRFALASTGVEPARGYSDANTTTAALGDLTKEVSIYLQSTPGTSNVTQGQVRQLVITPLN